jgi:hypothetical protein
MTILIAICICSFVCLIWFIRRNKLSLGLPIAYLYLLLMIHVPGAVAHIFGQDFLSNTGLTQLAMNFVAAASVCFVAGVCWSRRSIQKSSDCSTVDRLKFCSFCVLGGWFFIYGLSPLFRIPSVGAAVEKGSGIWMLGVLLGLRAATKRADFKWILIWLSALAVYPVVMLLLGGFLSYGAWAIVIVFAALTVATTGGMRVTVGVVLFLYIGLTIFVNYFQHRDDIRHEVWGGAPFAARIDSVTGIVKDFTWFDTTNRAHLIALDRRLNQNFFLGLAAARIQDGRSKYLYGESFWEGLLALVPRILWPRKPVFAGSPEIVSKMTGLRLSPTTSFGVGNVMEFQINFGMPGVVIGFFVLGWLIGALDLRAAVAEVQGDLRTTILYFLPSLALLDPQGSFVQLFGGSAAALVGALVWRELWLRFQHKFPGQLTVDRSIDYHESSLYQREPAC